MDSIGSVCSKDELKDDPEFYCACQKCDKIKFRGDTKILNMLDEAPFGRGIQIDTLPIYDEVTEEKL